MQSSTNDTKGKHQVPPSRGIHVGVVAAGCWLLAVCCLLLAAGTNQDKSDAGVQRAQRGLDVARKVTRNVDWRREIVIVSDGLPPLTSSSFQVVSSTLVTLPLGPRVQN
jgi:hypothetical protein